MPALRKVGVYGPTKVGEGVWELRWRLYLPGRSSPLERRRAFRGTGGRARAEAYRRRLENAAAGLTEHGQRWAFTDDFEPVLAGEATVSAETVWTLACAWRSATWRNQSGNGRKSASYALRAMVRTLVRDDASKPPVGVDGYLRAVAFRSETEPTDQELEAIADRSGDITHRDRGHVERWTVAEIREGRDWLVANSLPVRDVDRDRLRTLIAALGKGTAANTERRRWSTVKAVLNWAADETGPDGQPRVPPGVARGLKVRGAERATVEDVGEVPTVEEMWTLGWAIGLVAGRRWCALPTTLGGAGLRIGEAAALQRRHCEDDPATGGMWLTVRASLATPGSQWTDSGEKHERRGTKGKGPTGNTRGRRTYLPPAEADILRSHLALFVPRHRDALVFATNGGSPLNVPHLQRDVWKPARQLAFPAPHRLASMNRHSLRHLACTRWLRSGIALTTAARWGGWASVATMVDFYDSVLPNDDATAAAAVAATRPASPPTAAGPGGDTATRRSAA
ncbi:MAG: tyrosine-type recombinase/integrase [Acidimicrobiales bacterium]